LSIIFKSLGKNILCYQLKHRVGEKYMPIAFVLINTEIGSESDVLKTLKKVDGVVEAYSVYGVYDVIAKIKADSMDKLKEMVTWNIRRLDKVRSTLTMIVTEEAAK